MSDLRQRTTKGSNSSRNESDPVSKVSESKVHASRSYLEDDSRSFFDSLLHKHEKYIPLVILIVSFITRFFRLDVPRGVVFDEFHFGRFTNQYFSGTYLFDIHPPLGKLTFVFVGWLFGYDHTACSYAHIRDEFPPDCKFMVLRSTAALFGTITSPLFYYIARNFGVSLYGGILASSLFILDNLNLGESRLILMDSQLTFYLVLSLLLAQLWWIRLNRHSNAEDQWIRMFGAEPESVSWLRKTSKSDGLPDHILVGSGNRERVTSIDVRKAASRYLSDLMTSTERNLWCVALGISIACAISVKWTALATPGMIAVESFFGFFFLRRPAPFKDLFKILIVIATLYTLFFWIHFKLLPLSGDGDAFMSREFQRTLIGNTNYDPIAAHPGFFKTFIELNMEMLSANARISQRHPWESKWWEWPLNLRGLLFYSVGHDTDPTLEEGHSLQIYLLGNPAVIWFVFICLVLAITISFFYLRYRNNTLLDISAEFGTIMPTLAFCLVTYWLNLLPYILVNRSAFIYHYIPALVYGEIIAAVIVEQVCGRQYIANAVKSLIIIFFLTFAYYSPWVYGFPLTSVEHESRRLYHRWN